MTSKKNRAPLLYYIKLCASFQIHQWIQIRMTARKRSIQVEIGDFWSRATLKFDRRPWKTTRHLFYATLNFVYHFKAIGGFRLELQSGNTQFGSTSATVLSRVTLKFDGGLSKRIGYLSNTTSSVVHRFKAREVCVWGGGWLWKSIRHRFYVASVVSICVKTRGQCCWMNRDWPGSSRLAAFKPGECQTGSRLLVR